MVINMFFFFYIHILNAIVLLRKRETYLYDGP